MSQQSFKPHFRVTVDGSWAPGSRSIKVAGELDSGTSEMLTEAFERTVEEHNLAELVLDLREVSFVDSAGMRTMILLQRAADDREVRLVMMPPPAQVTELLRIAGVADRISLVFPAPEAAPGSEFTELVELELPRDPLAPSRARSEVRELIAGLLEEAELANLVLLTSEVVTNAVVHPDCAEGSPISLRIASYPRGVRIEVEDSGEGFDPAVPKASSSRGGGQGLFLVDQCSARWGAHPVQTEHGARFRVWFELEPGEPTAAAATGD